MIGITGHTSFLGRNLLRKLRSEGNDTLLFAHDIRDPRAVEDFTSRCDVIYHLAGVNRGPAEVVYSANAVGGFNLATSAKEQGGKHIVFPSSTYIDRFPEHPYAISKLMIERELEALASSTDTKVSIFRLANVYGPLALPFHVSVVATFCWYAANDRTHEMPIAGDGSQTVELVPIDAVVDCLLDALAQTGRFSWTRVRGQTLSVRELATIVADPASRKKYPHIEEMVRLFAMPVGSETFDTAGITLDRQWSETTDLDNASGSLGMETKTTFLPGEYTRPVTVEANDITVVHRVRGKVAVDYYDDAGDYVNTRILDDHTKFYEIVPAGMNFRVRNAGFENACLRTFPLKRNDGPAHGSNRID